MLRLQPDLLNQILWNQGPAISVLRTLPGLSSKFQTLCVFLWKTNASASSVSRIPLFFACCGCWRLLRPAPTENSQTLPRGKQCIWHSCGCWGIPGREAVKGLRRGPQQPASGHFQEWPCVQSLTPAAVGDLKLLSPSPSDCESGHWEKWLPGYTEMPIRAPLTFLNTGNSGQVCAQQGYWDERFSLRQVSALWGTAASNSPRSRHMHVLFLGLYCTLSLHRRLSINWVGRCCLIWRKKIPVFSSAQPKWFCDSPDEYKWNQSLIVSGSASSETLPSFDNFRCLMVLLVICRQFDL